MGGAFVFSSQGLHPSLYHGVGHGRQDLSPEFKKRGVKVIAVSVDPMDSHKGWINDINETQKTTMNYPIIADPDKKVATLYDMIHPNAIDNMTVRSVFIIGPDKKVKLTLTYPASCGRNFDELLRVIDSLQLTSKYKVATPANWKDGEDCIITPAVGDAEAQQLFPKGFKTVKPYLRYTPQPELIVFSCYHKECQVEVVTNYFYLAFIYQ